MLAISEAAGAKGVIKGDASRVTFIVPDLIQWLLIMWILGTGCTGDGWPLEQGAKSDGPASAFTKVTQAISRGDIPAFRDAAIIESSTGYTEGYFRWTLASARLHAALRDHGIFQGPGHAGWDEENEVSPNIPDVAAIYSRTARQPVEWIVEGNSARRSDAYPMTGTYGSASVERIDQRWRMVFRDPRSDDLDRMKIYGEAWSRVAKAIDATTEAVHRGQLATVREVNDYFEAEKRKYGEGFDTGDVRFP